MTDADFDFLRRFLKARSGLDLGPGKRYLAESRLKPAWTGAGLRSLADLVAALRTGSQPGLDRIVVDAMATHETLFFRDKTPFETMRADVLPRLLEARAATRRLRIWSAAASTGQEAYSVAILLAEMGRRLDGWQVTILGTDMVGGAVERARTGSYSQFDVQRGLPILSLLRHFEQGLDGWTVSARLRRTVEFRVMNLMEDFEALGTFDLILCRNLLIYLDADTKTELLGRLAAALAPDGALCLGTSESTLGLTQTLVPDPSLRGFHVHRAAAARHRVPLAG